MLRKKGVRPSGQTCKKRLVVNVLIIFNLEFIEENTLYQQSINLDGRKFMVQNFKRSLERFSFINDDSNSVNSLDSMNFIIPLIRMLDKL